MRFSVIIASYLGEYRTAAKNRNEKFVRAVRSVLFQSFQDFEVIIVADGCQKTVDLYQKHFADNPKVSCYLITRGKMWGGEPRNVGITNAKGDFILYLDIDDYLGSDHLQNISMGLDGYDWVWFDDIRYSVKEDTWYQNPCDIRIMGKHGTSNICHKRELPYKWDHQGYAHDYYFIKHLKQNTNHTKIEGGQYYVCHIPRSNEGVGYDL